MLMLLLCLTSSTGFAAKPQTPAAEPTGGTVRAVSQRPASAKIYVDGAELRAGEVDLPPGMHQLVAIATGYYGQSRDFEIRSGQHRAVNVVLQPTSLPTPVDVERFLVLADADAIDANDVQGTHDRVLRVALRAKLLKQQKNAYALERLRRDLAALIEKQDARSAVAGFLADAIVARRLDQSSFTAGLATASRSDPMASFFHAMAVRDSLRTAGDSSASSRQFMSYCEELRRTRSQGWGAVASAWLQRDACPE
jgi:hypothetical protein